MSILSKYGEWIFRCVLLIGICANLWLQQHFVIRVEFETTIDKVRFEMVEFQKENAAEHASITKVLTELNTAIKLMAQNETRITDHEQRIRAVETRQTDVIARLGAIERKP